MSNKVLLEATGNAIDALTGLIHKYGLSNSYEAECRDRLLAEYMKEKRLEEKEPNNIKTAIDFALEEIANRLQDTVLRLIENDPHQFTTRPCSTCKSVSSIVGKPFGCDKVRLKTRKKLERQRLVNG